MRSLLISTAFAGLLLACSPPAEREARTQTQQTPQVQACNDVAPNMGRLVRVEEALAVAAAASELRGGAITPGVYDLTRAVRIGEATGWNGEHAVALHVSENAGGVVVFNWAGAAPGGAIDSWTAMFADTAPQARLTYTCGRMGTVDASFAASADALQLRLPDGANGSLQLDFARRT